MGVPALFRWLSKKYPKIINPVTEEHPTEVEGTYIPVDTTKDNPNGEMDNLYLDFNGIVHPCSHPENGPPPATESEMMMEIFKYTERVVNMVRPRRLLLIAIDGVAPRAKMNQQRARRFRAAMDAKEADAKKAEFQTLLRRQQPKSGEENGETTMDEVIKKTWDSNVITPGTPFMFLLAQAVRYWAQWKLNTDPAWADLKVVISDASVPGEGEHKIMEFIRSQRSDPEYDPNTRHVMYGLDADLIMLGLGTHEPHFRILREDVFFQDAKTKGACKLCGQQGHYADQCRGIPKQKSGDFDEKASKPDKKPFIWLSVGILREYLAAELYIPGQKFRFDLERAIDDWVFMCFFVGNDFLPHLPSLDIHEDGIDKLIAIWRDNVPVMGGYLTCDGTVDLARAQCILQGLAKQEDAIFRKRKEVDEKRERNQKRRQDQDNRQNSQPGNKRRRGSPDYSQGARQMPPGMVAASSLGVQIDYNMIVNRGAVDKALASNKSAAAALKAQMLADKNGDSSATGVNGSAEAIPATDTQPAAAGKRKSDVADDADTGTPGRNTPVDTEPKKKFAKPDPDNPPPDTVRLWETGYADRYYEQKFHVRQDDIEFRHKVARSYVEGLSWVLLYYFQGCPSWTWYYPYHYAPFAADFVDLDQMKIKFEKGLQFHPYEQLMGVLPAASNHAIPKPFHPLMEDPDSEIIDFYPEEFELDMNGKKQEWKAVVLLPWIDEKRLLSAMATKYPQLTDDERKRNEFGSDALLFSDRSLLYDEVAMEFYSKKAKNSNKPLKLPMNKGRIAGTVTRNDEFLPHMDLRGPREDITLDPAVEDDRSMSVNFDMPPPTHVHKSMLFPGVKLAEKALDQADLSILKSKARSSGRDFGGAPLYDNTRIDPMDRDGRGNGRINYAADRPPVGFMAPPIPPPGMPPVPPPGMTARDNPFAAFLDPNFAGKGMPMNGRAPPPPMPPPQHQYGGQQYGQNHGPPAQGGYGGQRPPQTYGGYGNQNGGSNGYYGQGQQGGGRDEHRGQGQQQGYGGYYGSQQGGYGRR